MVVLKRKTNNEIDTEKDYDSVIDIPERKSYNASQKETAEKIYTPREAFVAKPRDEVMPAIKKEPKAAPVTKEALSSKTKVLLAAYIVIAVILAAVVIGTGIAITEVGNRAALTTGEIQTIQSQIEEQQTELALLNDPSHIAGEAMLSYNMLPVDDSEVIQVSTLRRVEVREYEPTTNAFDRFCEFVSKIFA